jgi:hypothetical protein
VFCGDDIFLEILVVICGVVAFRLRPSRAQQYFSAGSRIFYSFEDSDASGTLILTPSGPLSAESVAGISLDVTIALRAIPRQLPTCDSDRE